jgi:hypothetical protein
MTVRQRLSRLGLAPPPTAREVRELKARAAADLRTISNYVSHLVGEELKGKGRRRAPAGAKPGEKRRPYSIALYLPPREAAGAGGGNQGGEAERVELRSPGHPRSALRGVSRSLVRKTSYRRR